MSQNPFQSPTQLHQQAQGVVSGSFEDVVQVAKYQKNIVYCVLAYLCMIPAQFLVPAEIRPLVMLPFLLGVVITGAVFVFLLSSKIYKGATGVFYAILTLIPCLGLIVLLIINSKATTILKQNGIEVGILGANLNRIGR